MNKPGRFKTLAIASLSAIALAASIAVAQTVTTPQGDQKQGARPEWGGAFLSDRDAAVLTAMGVKAS